MSTTITPFLWFHDRAEEAAKFYVSLFPRSKITSKNPMTVSFTLNGKSFVALNGGPHYTLTPAYSMFVKCDDQKEVDRLWKKLTSDGGKESRCGWLVDKFGLSWQIVPKKLLELLSHPDRDKADRAMQAMLKMQKIEIAELLKACSAVGSRPSRKRAARGGRRSS